MNRFIIYTFLLLSFAQAPGHAQGKNLNRIYTPIIVKGYDMPEEIAIADWQAYRYHAASDTWTAIPWQVDEVDAEGKYNKEKDGRLDFNDELILMPADLGDRAPARRSPDGSAADARRIELVFTEPADAAQVAWAYLFPATGAYPSAPGYLGYARAPAGTSADTAKSRAYTLGHNRNGWIDFISLSLNPKQDLIDRLKLRLAGQTFFGGVGSYVFSEDTLAGDRTNYHPGIIRAFHDIETQLLVPQIWGQPLNVDYQLQYFPYSFRIGVGGAQVDPLLLAVAGLKSLRQSLDLSDYAKSAIFYTQNLPTGAVIDGQNDEFAREVDASAGAQWLMASGEWGTVFMILQLPNIRNAAMRIYYHDDQTGGTADGTRDSGDGHSIGDMGLWVISNTNALATDRLTLNFHTYMIDAPNLDGHFGAQLFAWDQNPLQVNISVQTGVGRAEQSRPGRFSLAGQYPNPFSAAGGVLTLEFTGAPAAAMGPLRIYNVLGQQVAALAVPPGPQERLTLRWDGRDQHGRPVQPGVYFLRYMNDGLIMSDKLTVVR